MASVKTAINIDDLRTLAKARLPRMVFDYIDGGAEDEITLRRQVDRYTDYELQWNSLVDISKIDTTTTVFGQPSPLPFFIAPTAASRLFHPKEGELAVARAAQKAGIAYSASTLASQKLADISAAAPDVPKIIQIYVWKDRGVVKEFLVQGGDPTGTGRGGASAFAGEPFADEFHTRLQFRRRGLVACAGAGAPDSNGSQFFVTLGRCDHLNKKHTIFGSVTGDSLYNLLRLGERETDADDRPVDPPRILGASVLENPFDDVAPRPRAEQVGRPPPAEEGAAGGGGEAARKGRGASKRPKAKDKLPSRLRMSMLSFGDDEEYEGYEEQAHAGGTVEAAREPPAGEAAVKAPGNEGAAAPPLRGAASEGGASRGPEKPPGAPAAAGDFGARMRAQVLEKRRRAEGPARGAGGGASAGGAGGAEPTAAGRSGAGPAGGGGGELGGRGVGQSLLRLKRPGGPPANEQKSLPEGGPPRKRRTGHGKREDGVIARLERAGRGGRAGGSGSAAPPAEPGGAGPRADRMDLPAAWRVDDYLDMEDEAGGGGGDDSAAGLRSHVLTFAERPRRPGEPRAGGDDWDDYEVIDPLLEKGKEAWERRQGAGGRRGEGRGAGGPSGGDRRRRSHRGSGGEPGADRGHRRGGGREDSGRRRRR